MSYVQITRPLGDLNRLPAKPYDGTLESIQGAFRLLDAMLQELYGGAGGSSGAGALITSTPGSGATTAYAPTGFGITTDRLDVVSDAADSILNDLTPGFDGQKVRVRNTGTGTLTLTSENAASTAAWRFTGAGDVSIAPGDSLQIVYYLGSVNRWTL